jgi:hypothetical protein
MLQIHGLHGVVVVEVVVVVGTVVGVVVGVVGVVVTGQQDIVGHSTPSFPAAA